MRGQLAALVVAGTALILAAGMLGDDLQPSARRLGVSALWVVAGVATWPGPGGCAREGGVRLAAWAVLSAVLAAGAMLVLDHGHAAWPVARSAALVAALVALGAALAWAAGAAWRRALAASLPAAPAPVAVQGAALGRITALAVLALTAAVPLWAGPLAEALVPRWPDAPSWLTAVSPLVHLALAAGNDLLRNGWFYAHANLATLPLSYPDGVSVAAGYALACTAAAVLGRRLSAPAARPPLLTPKQEGETP